MRRLPLVLLFPVVFACASQDAHASDASIIQRCEAQDGNAIYTDKPCAVFEARPSRVSDDLAIRLSMAEASNYPDAGTSMSVGAYRDASEPMRVALPGRHSPAAGCARSPQQLSRDLVGAFALGDVNRVAESYYWVGLNHRQSLPVMKQLARLSAQPLSDARFLAAWIGSGETAAAAMPQDAGLMQLVFAGDARIVDFEVRRYSGCYFIAS